MGGKKDHSVASGYYWVRFNSGDPSIKLPWTIAFYDDREMEFPWNFIGTDERAEGFSVEVGAQIEPFEGL